MHRELTIEIHLNLNFNTEDVCEQTQLLVMVSILYNDGTKKIIYLRYILTI